MAVGGVDDHAHILLSLPATVPISKAMQLIKAGSSKWMREEVSLQFQWQEAYAAFSIGISHVEETIHYINNQSAHHNKGLDFERELAMILAKHGIEPLQECLSRPCGTGISEFATRHYVPGYCHSPAGAGLPLD
jgi:putative transposase